MEKKKDAFTEKGLIWSFLRPLVGQLNYCLVHFRISLDSPQIVSFLCGYIHSSTPLFPKKHDTSKGAFNHAPTLATNTTLETQTRIFSNEANKKIWSTVRQHEFILITRAMLVE